NGYSKGEAEGVMGSFAAAVADGGHPYTEREASASLNSAYNRPAREPWGEALKRRRPTAGAAPATANGVHSNGAGAPPGSPPHEPPGATAECPPGDDGACECNEALDDPHRLARL